MSPTQSHVATYLAQLIDLHLRAEGHDARLLIADEMARIDTSYAENKRQAFEDVV